MRRLEDKIDLTEIYYIPKGVEWIYLVPGRDQWQAVVKTVIIFLVP